MGGFAARERAAALHNSIQAVNENTAYRIIHAPDNRILHPATKRSNWDAAGG